MSETLSISIKRTLTLFINKKNNCKKYFVLPSPHWLQGEISLLLLSSRSCSTSSELPILYHPSRSLISAPAGLHPLSKQEHFHWPLTSKENSVCWFDWVFRYSKVSTAICVIYFLVTKDKDFFCRFAGWLEGTVPLPWGSFTLWWKKADGLGTNKKRH